MPRTKPWSGLELPGLRLAKPLEASLTFDASWSEEFNTVAGDVELWEVQVRYPTWDFLGRRAKRPRPLDGE